MSKKLIVVIISGVLVASVLAVGLFNFLDGPPTKAGYRCEHNLRIIEQCKRDWALDYNKTTNDVPSWNDLQPFFPSIWSNTVPVCPQGGAYTIGRVGEPPTCSIGGPGHSISK